MRIIKIFIASSEELTPERRVLTDMEIMLNNRLLKRGIMLSLELWEHLDSSMGIKHKQEEYNDILRESDMCIALFWTKFGDYTNEEFEVAYNSMMSGTNPQRVFVLFKDAENITQELQIFKENFEAKYGHFYGCFNSLDSLRMIFLQQIEACFSDLLPSPFYNIEANIVYVDEVKILSLDKIII